MMDKIFMKISVAIVILVMLGATIYSFFRPNGVGFSEAQVQEIVKDYLMENPEIIIESVQKYQENERMAQQESARQHIEENYAKIANDDSAPVIGNPEGDVTVVEFFDYSCGYCKRVLPHVLKLIEEDKNVRVVMKEYPILGQNSLIAAKAALAVHMIAPEKYIDLHEKLMKDRVTGEEYVLQQVAAVGLDKDAVKAKMESDEVNQILADNMSLARSMGVNGTPAFLVGKQFIPGAIDYDTLKQLVKDARNN